MHKIGLPLLVGLFIGGLVATLLSTRRHTPPPEPVSPTAQRSISTIAALRSENRRLEKTLSRGAQGKAKRKDHSIDGFESYRASLEVLNQESNLLIRTHGEQQLELQMDQLSSWLGLSPDQEIAIRERLSKQLETRLSHVRRHPPGEHRFESLMGNQPTLYVPFAYISRSYSMYELRHGVNNSDFIVDLMKDHQLPAYQLLKTKLETESLRRAVESHANSELKKLSSLLELSESQQHRAKDAFTKILTGEISFSPDRRFLADPETPRWFSRLKALTPVLSKAQLEGYLASLEEQ